MRARQDAARTVIGAAANLINPLYECSRNLAFTSRRLPVKASSFQKSVPSAPDGDDLELLQPEVRRDKIVPLLVHLSTPYLLAGKKGYG